MGRYHFWCGTHLNVTTIGLVRSEMVLRILKLALDVISILSLVNTIHDLLNTLNLRSVVVAQQRH